MNVGDIFQSNVNKNVEIHILSIGEYIVSYKFIDKGHNMMDETALDYKTMESVLSGYTPIGINSKYALYCDDDLGEIE